MNITNELWVKILTENQVYTTTVEVSAEYLQYEETIHRYDIVLIDTDEMGGSNVHSITFNNCLEIETQPGFEYSLDPAELTLALTGDKFEIIIKLERIILGKEK